MSLTDEERAILRKAADEVERRGLTYGQGASDSRDLANCSVCTMGAIAVGAGYSPEDYILLAHTSREMLFALADAVNPDYIEAFGDAFVSAHTAIDAITDWNDQYSDAGARIHYFRTKKEVAAKLREVADEA